MAFFFSNAGLFGLPMHEKLKILVFPGDLVSENIVIFEFVSDNIF